MSGAECADGIISAFKGRGKLSEQEIQFISEELRRRFKRAKSSGEDVDWHKVGKGLADDIKETAAIERRNKALNLQTKQRLLNIAQVADERYGDPSLAVESAMVGINRPLPGGRLSADTKSMAIFDEHMGPVVAELERDNLLQVFNSGSLDLEVARALEKITKPEARGTTDANAQRIAEVIHKYRKLAVDRQNRAGSWIKQLSGYITRQSHDRAKLHRAGFEAWRDAILPELDPRTFGDSAPEPFLRAAYNTLLTGEDGVSSGATINLNLAFKGPGNLGKRLSQHRVLHFKDADSWARYNAQFGTGNLRESIMGEFVSLARNTALMETLGPNPKAMIDDVLQTLRQQHRGDLKRYNRLRRRTLSYMTAEITGESRIAQNVTAASIGRGVRSWISISKLGGAILSSVTDIASVAAEIRYKEGGGLFTPFAKSIGVFFDGIPSAQKKEVADRVRVGLDGMIGGIAERFGAADSPAGLQAKVMRTFFKLNLLAPWTDANKRGMALFASRTLASHAQSAFDQLPEHMRFILGEYNLDASKWDIARQLTAKGGDGTTFMLPDMIANLPETEFTRRGLDPVSDRDQIQTAIRAFFVDTTEFGVPSPGARERAMLTMGFQPGTIEGESIRFLMQFKAFPVTIMTKVLGRAAYGRGANNLFEALALGRGDRLGLATYIASSTLLGYAAMSMKSLQRGQSPRDPLDYKTVLAAMTQGGGFGIYGDFLFGERSRMGGGLLDTLAGPGLGTVSDINDLWQRVRDGDDFGASAFRIALNNTPFINLFYTRVALDYLILFQLQEALNPGYLRRRERQIKKEQNQRYLLPAPSTVIPRGGGDRLFEGVR